MVFKRFFGILIMIVLNGGSAALADNELISRQQLGWVATDKAHNLCQGYYIDEPIHFKANPQLTHPDKSYNITADSVDYGLKGPSILSGHVVFKQPNRRLKADKIWLYRSQTNNHPLSKIKAQGHLHLYSPNQLILARSGVFNLQNNRFKLKDVMYRVSSNPQASGSTQHYKGKTVKAHSERHFRGHAKSIKRVSGKHFVLKNATLTTCPPTSSICPWQVQSSTVKLNTAQGVGHAYNSLFWFHGAPIFYTPYLSFPLNNKRKSGFLYPSYGRKDNSGMYVSFPYYFNLAPNYDLTLTPTYYTKRGLMLGGLFRYLTHKGSGQLQASFMPHDRRFGDFKNDAPHQADFQGRPEGLERLENDSTARYSIRYHDQFQWSKHWFSQLHYNRVSDDYFIQDFGDNLINNSKANLLQKAQAQYQGINWQVTGFLQNYQTLHPVNRQTNSNQYARLPEIQAQGNYAGVYPGLDPSVSIQSVYFHKEFRPDGSNGTPVNGERLHVQPDIQYNWNRPYGYLKPEILLNMTRYWLADKHQGLDSQASEAIPTFDLHGKLDFVRSFDFAKGHYEQTLEPEFFYVYTPDEQQNDVPLFDTGTRSFDYNFMFDRNRFSGVDRIGDANRMTVALTSRLLNADTGGEKASFSVGDIIYFHNRQVTHCTGSNCQPGELEKRSYSPIAAKGEFDMAQYWSGKVELNWNTYAHQFSREQASLDFQKQQRYLADVSYELVRDGGAISGDAGQVRTKLEQVKVGGAWKVTPRWRVLGHLGYSWSGNNSEGHGNTYLAGLEYDSCCWGIRLVGARSFQGVDEDDRNQYDDKIYLQFIFKGLGSVGNRNPSSLLSNKLSNYKSNFNEAKML